MADFVQMMKDWRRMCKAFTTDDDFCCCGCPVVDLHEHGCGAIFEMEDGTDWERYEGQIREWAAENPEPVYETWYEYLNNLFEPGYTVSDAQFFEWICDTPIPADIAQKLGIEPKEDT